MQSKQNPKWKVALSRPFSYFAHVEQSHLVVTVEAVHESTQHLIRDLPCINVYNNQCELFSETTNKT